MRILLTGGGTLGSVGPLLAVVPDLTKSQHEVVFVGTRQGPEQAIINRQGIPFHWIIAPKLRRYISGYYFLVPFQLLLGLVQSFYLLVKLRPRVIVSAGGFVAVPIIWAGWVMQIPIIIHQQDLKPGLANIMTHLLAKKITVNFADSLAYFPKNKTIWLGNPVRDLAVMTKEFQLDPQLPTVLIMGGGTGAQAINDLVTADLCNFANIIHITGQGKQGENFKHPRYHCREFLIDAMNEALAVADVIVARAGLGTISELAVLKKPAIFIPIPHTHQEANAAFLRQHHAAVILDQNALSPASFCQQIKDLVQDKNLQRKLAKNIAALARPDAAAKFVELIMSLSSKSHS